MGTRETKLFKFKSLYEVVLFYLILKEQPFIQRLGFKLFLIYTKKDKFRKFYQCAGCALKDRYFFVIRYDLVIQSKTTFT